MRLSLSEQKRLDILAKELRLKMELLKEDAISINPSIKSILEVMGDVILLLEQKVN